MLQDYVETHKILGAVQKGFRPTKHTGQQLLWLTGLLEDANMSAQDIHVLYVDFQSAYNSLSLEKMAYIYKCIGIPDDMITALMAMQKGASTRVATPGGHTERIPTRRGVAQGNKSSPTEFALFMVALTRWLEVGEHGYHPCLCEIRIRECIGVYADDIALLCKSLLSLKTQMRKIAQFSEWSGMTARNDKSAYTALVHKKDGTLKTKKELAADLGMWTLAPHLHERRTPFSPPPH